MRTKNMESQRNERGVLVKPGLGNTYMEMKPLLCS